MPTLLDRRLTRRLNLQPRPASDRSSLDENPRHAGRRRPMTQLLDPRTYHRASTLRHARTRATGPGRRLLAGTVLAAVLVLAGLVAVPRPLWTPAREAPQSDASAPAAPGAPVAGVIPADWTPSSAADVRTRAEQVLGQHAVLTTRVARALVRGDADLAHAAEAALVGGTADLARLVGSTLGPDVARDVERLWTRNVAALSASLSAAAAGDAQATAEARNRYAESAGELGALLSDRTAGGVDAAAVRSRLEQYLDRLVDGVRSYADADYSRAYQLGRQAYAGMFELGGTLGGALAARVPSLAGDAGTPQRELQSRLGMLLGEHTQLAVDTMRSALADSPDFAGVVQAMEANTADLAATVSGLFGAEAGEQVTATWADQMDALAAYTRAVAARDEAGKESARERLRDAGHDLASLLASWTEGRLAQAGVATALASADALLVDQIDAYGAGDYGAAQAASVESFRALFAVADSAGEAFGATVAARAPVGGIATGLGGTAPDQGRH